MAANPRLFKAHTILLQGGQSPKRFCLMTDTKPLIASKGLPTPDRTIQRFNPEGR
jgi:hypothetical protein